MDEKVAVPLHLIGHVIGKKGQMLREIRIETGAQVIVEDYEVYLKGTKEQCQRARAKIQAIIDVSNNIFKSLLLKVGLIKYEGALADNTKQK